MYKKHDSTRLSQDRITRVLHALENDNFKWRTVDGIIRETELTSEEVLLAFENLKKYTFSSDLPEYLMIKNFYFQHEHISADMRVYPCEIKKS